MERVGDGELLLKSRRRSVNQTCLGPAGTHRLAISNFGQPRRVLGRAGAATKHHEAIIPITDILIRHYFPEITGFSFSLLALLFHTDIDRSRRM